jgi:molybdopterin-binding protein
MDDAIRIGAAATTLGVSIDTLRRWERDGRVTFERRGRQRYMTSLELARLLRERTATGVASARNRLSGVVLGVRRDGAVAQIDLACGPHRVVSLMSREAADQLDLKPGDPATAVIKAATVVVERRDGQVADERRR